MKKNLLRITRTAVMLALLIALQAITKPLGQLVTGSCVNAVLAVTVLTVGLAGGIDVALLSPFFAFLLGIAPQALTVPAIMAGNCVYVLVLHFITGKENNSLVKMILAWLAAAIAKFLVLYGAVIGLICGVFSQRLLASGALKAPMLKALPATFSWPQLITALMGGGIALLIAPILRKALRK